MKAWLKNHPGLVVLTGAALLLASAGVLSGAVAAIAFAPQAPATVPLHALGSDTGTSMSLATGPIDGNMEGVFFLDFVTGDLRCMVLYPRKPDMVGGVFQTNVIKDLGIEGGKKPAYLMVTGAADFVGKGVSAKPGGSVVYVLDQNTGAFAGYGLTWDATSATALRPQAGALVRLVVGNARAKAE
jgi:hypothetical protein